MYYLISTDILFIMTKKEQVLALIRQHRVLRPRDLSSQGLPSYYLHLLAQEGSIKALGRGLYASNTYLPDEKSDYVEIAKRIPSACICLISALRFYELTTQNPAKVWIAIGNKDRMPRIGYPPISVVRFSGGALSEGLNNELIDGIEVRVYCVAKTIADCFKFRNKIGIEIAIEALREGWQKKIFSLEELNHYAKLCRVEQVMRPYIDCLIL